MSITGPAGHPSKIGVALVDVITGLHATTAVLAALRERDRSGEGSASRSTCSTRRSPRSPTRRRGWLRGGVVPRPLGNVHPSIEPFATYRAGDGDLMICAGNDRQFRALREASARPSSPTTAFRDERPARREPRRAAAALEGGSQRGLRAVVGATRRGRRPRRAGQAIPGRSPRAAARSRRRRRDRRRAHGRLPGALSRTPAATPRRPAGPRRARRRDPQLVSEFCS